MGKIKSVIGLEIDSSEIRAIEMSRSNGIYSVHACGKIPLAEGVIEEGFVRDADAFNVSLTELFQNGGFKALDVTVGINNENVIMRYASFPKVPDDKLRNMVLLQAQEFIPIPVQEMEIDYVVAGEGVNDEDQPVVNVLIVAARRMMLEQIITILGASKLQVIDIDSSVLSICRALQDIAKDAKFALLNLTDDMLNFLVVEGAEISMVRSITIPERAVTAVKNLFKGSAGIPVADEDIEAVGALLASETASSISYYAMQNSENPIKNIYFVSSTNRDRELVAQISEVVSTIPAVVPEFYTEMDLGLETEVVKEFAGCIGLAVQALEG